MVSRVNKSLVAMAAIFLVAIVGVFASMSASALADPVGEYQVWSHACGTSVSRITSPTVGKSFKTFQMWNNSATPVFFGASDVDTVTGASATGWPICNDTAVCPRAFQEIDGIPTSLHCKAGSTIQVLIWGAR